jgi:N-acetylmuramoyl-L-alanine amidase
LHIAGAHTLGHNEDSIGVCYVGGMGGDNRTDMQKETLHRVVQALIQLYGHMTVHGHDEFSDKSCPNFDVKTEFEYINEVTRR